MRAHTPVKAASPPPPRTPLLRKEDEGLREPGTIGVTFCPLLLGARCRSSASWADVRHQAGCQAGREHSLTFVEVVLARKKKAPPASPGLSTQARRLGGGGGYVTSPAQATMLQRGQGFILWSNLTGHTCKRRPREGRVACLASNQAPNSQVGASSQQPGGLPPQKPSQLGTGVEGWRTAVGAPRLLLNPSQQGRPCLLSVWSQTAGPGAARRGCFCPHSLKTQHLTHWPMYRSDSLPTERTGRGAVVREGGPERGGDVLPKETEVHKAGSHSPVQAYFP